MSIFLGTGLANAAAYVLSLPEYTEFPSVRRSYGGSYHYRRKIKAADAGKKAARKRQRKARAITRKAR